MCKPPGITLRNDFYLSSTYHSMTISSLKYFNTIINPRFAAYALCAVLQWITRICMYENLYTVHNEYIYEIFIENVSIRRIDFILIF